MNRTFKLLFFLRKPKLYEQGPQPIYLRITVNGQRSEISVQRECEPDLWNEVAGRMTGTRENARQLNAYLDGLVTKVYTQQNDLIQNEIPVTADAIKNRLSGKPDKSRMLVPIFEQHNKDIAKLVGREYSPSTLNRYETSLMHVTDFMESKMGISDIDIRKLNHEFITDFNFYLRSVRHCNNNSAMKYIRNFKKIVLQCVANDWLNKDPFIKFKIKVKEVERAFLSEEELQVLHDKEFQIERLNQVKDIFLFSCYTGLAYIDAKNLTQDNIVIGIDGNHWIHTHRKKTDTPSHIPLLPPAMEIIAKYKAYPTSINQNVLLPLLSNQKMNAYLKEIANCCEIKKELTFHIARHTFATTVTLSNGIPLESVSKMLGHKNLRTTQHYAKILDKKVSQDMSSLFKKFKKNAKLKKVANK